MSGSQFVAQLSDNVRVDQDLPAPIGFGLVKGIALGTTVFTTDIGVELMVITIQSARLKKRSTIARAHLHQMISPGG